VGKLKHLLKTITRVPLKYLYPTLYRIEVSPTYINQIKDNISDSTVSEFSKIYSPASLSYVTIDAYSYIAQNSYINVTDIGKFCSIGPNLFCAWGIHPTNGISTSPALYSTKKQCGYTFSDTDKIEELLPIKIGNDVFIGMNVTILNGITIGDGAIIGAGTVVSKNIPPYAVAYGNPIKVVRYRFDEITIEKLLKIKWWNFDSEKLKDIEQHFFDIDYIIKKYS
jgi:virginiamycin A acetyltransferase